MRFALRRSGLSPHMLGLYAAALEANGRCTEAASLAASASTWFDSSCYMRDTETDEVVRCSADVQNRLGAPRAPCKRSKGRTASTTTR